MLNSAFGIGLVFIEIKSCSLFSVSFVPEKAEGRRNQELREKKKAKKKSNENLYNKKVL